MIHKFTSETMEGSFNACDLCNHTTPNEHKCFCQCSNGTCFEPSVKHRSVCEAHGDEERAAQVAAEQARIEALAVVPPSSETGMFYCSAHDTWATDWEEICWDYETDAPSTDCVVHPGIKGTAAYPDLHEAVSETFYEQFGDDSYDELPAEIDAALTVAVKVIERHAPALYEPDMKVRIETKVSA